MPLARGVSLAAHPGVRALQPSGVSEEQAFLAMTVGWCIEWLQAFFLVADDMMDHSITRRGQPCWYKVPKVGLNACNDCIILEACIYRILKKHAAKLPCYVHVRRCARARLVCAPRRPSLTRARAPRPQLLELFHDTTYQTSCGQLIDLITAPIGVVRCARRTQPPALAVSHAPRRAHRACPRAALALTPGRATQVDLSKYTIETYMRIVTYKTAFYTFYLPAASAMHLCGITDEAAFTLAREVCMRLGQFFQIQDDYLDCYGDPAVIGKVGTDIEDNKCSWLVVQALARCTPAQRSVFEARHAVALPRRRPCADAPRAPRPPALPLPLQHNYGQNDPVKVAAIKAVYAELKMEAQYQEYEASAYAELCTLIQEQSLLPKGLFMEMLAKIYKRVK